MKKIMFPKGGFAQVDDEDFVRLSPYSWHKHHLGYAFARIGANGKKELMHRFIIDAPTGLFVDHVNGDKLDNRKINLRLCSPHDNARSKTTKSKSSSGYRGVSRNVGSKKYNAAISIDGKAVGLGRFETPEEAALAYDKKAMEVYGEFANLNFPSANDRSVFGIKEYYQNIISNLESQLQKYKKILETL